MSDSTPNAAAMRMRRFRARRRAAGLVDQRAWVEPAAPEVWSDHKLLDVRSLALHALVAGKIVADPSLIERARKNLARWADRYAEPPSYIEDWQRVLRHSPGEIACFLVSSTDEATRLRQSSPFAGLLPPEKRRALLDLFRPVPRDEPTRL